jgi:hypothetical protein
LIILCFGLCAGPVKTFRVTFSWQTGLAGELIYPGKAVQASTTARRGQMDAKMMMPKRNNSAPKLRCVSPLKKSLLMSRKEGGSHEEEMLLRESSPPEWGRPHDWKL